MFKNVRNTYQRDILEQLLEEERIIIDETISSHKVYNKIFYGVAVPAAIAGILASTFLNSAQLDENIKTIKPESFVQQTFE